MSCGAVGIAIGQFTIWVMRMTSHQGSYQLVSDIKCTRSSW